MLIQRLLKKQQQELAQLTEQSQQQQRLLSAQQQQLIQTGRAFAGSTPGLITSFGLGCLFQMRHNSTVKLLWRMVDFRWFMKP